MGCDSADALEEQNRMLISIHAARMGCDTTSTRAPQRCQYFNPRSPNGLRPRDYIEAATEGFVFQSTQPEWAATALESMDDPMAKFQSTQPEWAATSGGYCCFG